MWIIMQENLEKFLQKLKEEFEVFDVRNDKLPFKKYFFPPQEEIFTKNPMSKSKTSDFKTPEPPKEFVLYGLSLPALEALTQLDEIMKKPNKDFFYFQRREKSVVIGLIEEPVDVVLGGDIVLQKIDRNRYKILIGSEKGRDFIKQYSEYFQEEKLEEKIPQVPIGSSLGEWSQTMRQLLLDSELLASAVEWSWKNSPKVWEELAEKCLSCGICTYVCPLCYCFSMEDRVGLDDKCSRCRKWDSCILPNFSKIAGGYSFRKTLKERYYNWFYHKFVRAYKEYGKSQCVGCGACKKNCPAQIDIQEVLRDILEGYKKSQ